MRTGGIFGFADRLVFESDDQITRVVLQEQFHFWPCLFLTKVSNHHR